MFNLHTRLTSSLEKGFLEQWPEQFPALHRATILRNQHLAFQLLYRLDADNHARRFSLKIEGELAPYVTLYTVEQVPVLMPCFLGKVDDNYLRTTPGLYPDLLQPIHYSNALFFVKEQLRSLWINVDTKGQVEAGIYPLSLVIHSPEGEELRRETLEIEILAADLPDHGLILTQWFHCDCLANYYGYEVFSERHWEIMENFMRTAVEYGQNMILTPLFTPPLDTAVGGERLTTQLVAVTKNGDEYTFDFTLLDRYMDTALRAGMKYFEMSHLFTQWGAAHAPKIMATVDGEYRRIFGWESDATGEEYTTFLQDFLPALITHLKERGLDKACKYHISDEPNDDCLEQYRRAQAVVAEALEGYDIMDALSSFEFYKQDVTKMPIPASNHIEPFLTENISGLWTYYCCAQHTNVSNRFIAQPSWRNRALGMQCFKYDIAGFLQWGYNFYNNMYSVNSINPYLCNDGEMQVPAGDAFVVYPGQDGHPMVSLRLVVFRESLEDIAAMKLAASLCGKDAVVAAIENAYGKPVRFDDCPHTADEMLRVRAAVDALIKENV
ncbi:MAG: DUF4091 domain-containing protein [Clostridia bacterium]|nr:DUF4091 domain-containing protein [Clostridia bacterium]